MPAVTLAAAQQATLKRLVPGLEITPLIIAKLQKFAMDDSLGVDQRLTEMQKLTRFHLKHPIHVSVCIWHISGKFGPIFTAAQEQRAAMRP